MGFWDLHVGDLEATGITIGEMDLKFLEQGGPLLHLQHVSHPESGNYRVEGLYDQNGEPVLVAERLHAFPPTTPITNPQHWSQEMPGATPIDIVESEWGSNGWRDYPTYLAVLEDYDRYYGGGWTSSYWRGEQILPYRFWGCAPLLDETIVEPMQRACQNHLDDAMYYDVCAVVDLERMDDYWADIVVIWQYHHARHQLDAEDEQAVEDWVKYIGPDRDFIQPALEAYERLYKAGHYPPPDVPRGEWPNLNLKPLTFRPVEEYLEDQPMARMAWKSLVRQRKYVIGRLTAHMTEHERLRFSNNEGDIL